MKQHIIHDCFCRNSITSSIASLQTSPTARYATHYKMNHSKRGIALIFNQEFFTAAHLKPRIGTNVDCDNLINTLKNLGFEVNDVHNSTHADIVKQLERGKSYLLIYMFVYTRYFI